MTVDPTFGALGLEILLGNEHVSTLKPLGDGRVLVDGPSRLIRLSDLHVQAIEGGEGSLYEMVSVDRSERFAIVTFDESSQADFIDLS